MPIYDYKCNSCKRVKEQLRKTSEREDTFPCKCGSTMSLTVSAPHVLWLALGLKDSHFPTANDKWLADRTKRKQKEEENVANHGTEYPNLRAV